MIKIVISEQSDKSIIDFTKECLQENNLDYNVVVVEEKGKSECGFSFVTQTPYLEFPNRLMPMDNQGHILSCIQNYKSTGHPRFSRFEYNGVEVNHNNTPRKSKNPL